MLKNIKDSLEISYKQGLEPDDNIYIKGQIKDWEEMLSNIKHEQELKDNALKMYDKEQKENERINNIINELEKYIKESRWKGDWGVESIYVKSIYVKTLLLNKLQELKGSDK